MKIKNIAAICKKQKAVVLFNRYHSDGETVTQYMGDGAAAYPISGLPELDEESVLTIFDVPEKQREDWFVRYKAIPEGINFEDTDANEMMIERGRPFYCLRWKDIEAITDAPRAGIYRNPLFIPYFGRAGRVGAIRTLHTERDTVHCRKSGLPSSSGDYAL